MLTNTLILFGSWMLFFILLTLVTKEKSTVQQRMKAFLQDTEGASPELAEEPDFSERVVRPVLTGLYRLIERVSPKGMVQRTELKLRMIGMTGIRAVQQWMALRLIVGVVLPILIVVLLFRLDFQPIQIFLSGLISMAVAQGGMTFYLIQGIRGRKESMEKQLPDILDIITVSVEAGLSFDGALERVVQKMQSHLSYELGITLKEMRMGKIRRQALRDLSDRCQVPDLTTWIGAMIQADELGVGIGNVLRIQSIQMREKRKQRAQEKSMKAPIKMMFPLVFFIFPTIFVVLLGPAVIQVMQAMK